MSFITLLFDLLNFPPADLDETCCDQRFGDATKDSVEKSVNHA